MPTENDSQQGIWAVFSRVSYIGIFFGVAICIGFFGGRWLDGKLHTQPWLSLVGLFIGIAAGFTELVRVARHEERLHSRSEKDTERKP